MPAGLVACETWDLLYAGVPSDPSEVQELSAEEPDRLADLSEKLTVWLKKTEAFIPTEINPKYDGVKSE